MATKKQIRHQHDMQSTYLAAACLLDGGECNGVPLACRKGVLLVVGRYRCAHDVRMDSTPQRLSAMENVDSNAKYVIQTLQWTERIPIGLGLCPWAGKSLRSKRLRIVACDAHLIKGARTCVLEEAKRLCECSASEEWTTTLVVCPRVSEWQDDFDPFDRCVQSFKDGDTSEVHSEILDQLTLVAFHPKFTRWHALPYNIGVESLVYCHRGMCGFEKSKDLYSAKIIETEGSNFGRRKVKVRFDNDGKEQYVPIDWLMSDRDGNSLAKGEALPDNVMHRAPYPTIHLIRNTDLASLCARNVSRVKRKNAQLMERLGWDGIRETQSEK